MSSKRKADDEAQHASSGEESDGELQDIVDVDFDFYNPDEIDFHALKRLLRQLFSSDAELIPLGDIADILIEENHVGTTIKVDGQESDPYAILSVINLMQNKDKEGVRSLVKYLLGKCPKKQMDAVQDILSLDSKDAVGWVVSERFINMPVEVMPPMYTIMQQEVQDALAKNEPYKFEWYMFISKTYKEVESTLEEPEEEQDVEESRPKKKTKKASAVATTPVYVQPEDEIIAKYATHQFDFKFTNSEKEAASDAKRAFSEFGIDPSRRLLLVPQAHFTDLVSEIEKTCSSIAKQ